jgi:hypothetical protein
LRAHTIIGKKAPRNSTRGETLDFTNISGNPVSKWSFEAVYETICQSILDLVAKARRQSLTLIGHSLGAALATICSLGDGLPAAADRPPDHVVPIC